MTDVVAVQEWITTSFEPPAAFVQLSTITVVVLVECTELTAEVIIGARIAVGTNRVAFKQTNNATVGVLQLIITSVWSVNIKHAM